MAWQVLAVKVRTGGPKECSSMEIAIEQHIEKGEPTEYQDHSQCELHNVFLICIVYASPGLHIVLNSELSFF